MALTSHIETGERPQQSKQENPPMTTANLSELTTKELVILYNDCADTLGRALVNKFTDRATAVRRVAAIQAEMPAKVVAQPTIIAQDTQTMSDNVTTDDAKAEAKAAKLEAKRVAAEAKASERQNAAKAKAAAKAAKDAAKAEAATTHRGRASGFSGKRLFTLKETNTRRQGVKGWHSLQIIFNQPGVTYEQFIELGGRNVDLAWDIAHGNAKAE
jgi:hypothetical protein